MFLKYDDLTDIKPCSFFSLVLGTVDLVCDISDAGSPSTSSEAIFDADRLADKSKSRSKRERRRKEALMSMMSMKSVPPAGAVRAASHLLCSPTAGFELARRYFASLVTHHPPAVRCAVSFVLI